MRFVDTNVLLYSLSTDADEEDKAQIALALLGEKDLALSVQVLQEFYTQATRPTKPDRISHEQASLLVDAYLRFPVQETTVELARNAAGTCRRFGIGYWDAAIIEAARSLGCGTLLTEDLNDGQDYAGVRVENPFSPSRRSR